MQYETIIADDGQHAHLRVREDITPAVSRAILTEMASLQHRQGIYLFLLDVRGVSARTSPVDDYRVANREVASSGFDSSLTRVALLKSPGDSSHDFIETVGRNAGQSIRLFEEMDTALAWLRSGARAAV